MLKIRINKNSGKSHVAEFAGDIKEAGEHYFSMKLVESIDILSGGTFENEFYKKTPFQIFRADPEEIEKFELFHNIRIMYKTEYKEPLLDGTTCIISSRGLCRV